MIFFDTSAFLALLNRNDIFHKKATAEWKKILYENQNCLTNSFVLLESIAILQRRLGVEAARELRESILPHLHTDWVDKSQHAKNFDTMLSENRRKLSLVDISAFATMRRLGIRQVFTFDQHFAEQGFEVLP